MRKDFIDILCCPECAAKLSERGDRLECGGGHSFAVKAGVPRFVASDSYASNFGFEWSVFSRTQLDGARTNGEWSRDLYGHGRVTAAEESQRTFELKTGFTADEIRGKRVLDVGCGMGRFADVASRHGAEVVGVDLTQAIDSAAKNLGDRPNVNLVQADLRKLPFPAATFDAIYSIGVLHHTPDTRSSFAGLVRLLKPGGTIAIWVYERARWRKVWLPPAQAFSDLYRVVTTRLPHSVLLPLCRARARLDDSVRSPALKKALMKLVPASDHPDVDWRTLDTFDWYSPRYQWKHTDDEVRSWFVDQGLSDIRVLGVPVAVRGRRAAG